MNSSGLGEFETQLKTVVTSKRLSGSKMAALTELAMENMHLDTQMISLLYRTHKGLPTPNKISSLYVFDSIARAAHRTKTKKGLVADLNSSGGNAASFLVRLEGMLDGVVDDMLANGPPEAKEKTRKVLDIWTREGTFPAGVLKRLSERVSGSSAAPVPTQGAGAQLSQQLPHTPPTPATPSSTIASLPPAILALLGSAVPPTQPPPPQQFNLDPTQLALINQLTAQSQSATPPFSPARNGTNLPHTGSTLPTNVLSTNGLTITTGQSGSFSPTAPPYSPVRKDTDAPPGGGAPSFDRSRSRSPKPQYERSPRVDDRKFEDRSRFGEGSRFGDDRDSRFNDRSPRTTDPRRFSEDTRSRDPRRRSRSPRNRRAPSPGRRGSPGRRPLSPGARPPRRPPSPNRGSGRAPLPGAGESGKDEFGRELRDGSGERSPVQAQTNQSQSYTNPSQSYQNPSQSHQPSTRTGAQTSGLESFDMSAFNPADPASWTALAVAWETTNGRGPTQEEMMVFVMGGGAMGAAGASTTAGGGDMGGSGWEQGQGRGRGRGRGRGGFRGRGRGRGRGGFGGGGGGGNYGGGEGYGGGYGGDAYGGGGYGGGSDAVVLGGGDDSGAQGYDNGQGYGNAQGYEYGAQDYGGNDNTNSAPAGSSGGGGGMKKIDGKWVWTKN